MNLIPAAPAAVAAPSNTPVATKVCYDCGKAATINSKVGSIDSDSKNESMRGSTSAVVKDKTPVAMVEACSGDPGETSVTLQLQVDNESEV